MSIDNPNTEFHVVINEQEQYSIWPSYHPIPKGWSEVGISGKKAVCLEYIKENWTDMRPKSLRVALSELGQA
ncbi:MbtH family protein [Enterovibrio calviensis]|uniref:MbtH family protein n=1 Tax=Enterovibrio calviensis TaxID=91359 RepID=UPI0037370C05